MRIEQAKVRKFLSKKINQLNEIIADLDSVVHELGHDFFRVCIFGSARIKENTPEYQQVYQLAQGLAALGADIVTGGGPGLMEAANRGARESSANHSRSIGLSIQLPFEADANAHLDVKYHHRKFSSRLDDFMRLSHAVVVTPGGIGTLLELFYTWQLLQVEHLSPRPLILLGDDMWGGLVDWMKDQPLSRGLVDAKDIEMVRVVNSVDECLSVIQPLISNFKPASNKS